MTSLKNEVSDNSNINLNGHKLYVNGEAINAKSYKDNTDNNAVQNETNNHQLLIILITAGVLIAAIILIIFISKKKKK